MLDTNIISEAWKKSPDVGVTNFLKTTAIDETFISLFTVAELLYGIKILPKGKKKENLKQALRKTLTAYQNSLISPDLHVSEIYAELAAMSKQKGVPKPIFDLWIAASAKTHNLSIVTRNTHDFTGLRVNTLNPFSKET